MRLINRFMSIYIRNAHPGRCQFYLEGERRVYNLGIERTAATRLFPRSTICPITGSVFVDPVVCTDGQSYERVAIECWLMKRHMSHTSHTSPVTGACIGTRLITNHALRNVIDELDARKIRNYP